MKNAIYQDVRRLVLMGLAVVSCVSVLAISANGNLAENPSMEGDFVSQDPFVADYYLPQLNALLLLSSNGGEELIAGATYDVIWNTEGIVANVLIEYSTDNGAHWTPVETVANTGSYHWKVPGENSEECLLQISNVAYPIVNDISDDVLTIHTWNLPIEVFV